ncbi:MAG: hypothetical protein C5B51_30530 [Terriglobia bacterium]|nr:MAG: hypothetical protein C5B51_30530 [Terriglobia bacterium]
MFLKKTLPLNLCLLFVSGVFLTTASGQPYAYVSNVSGNVVTVVNPANGGILGSIRVPSGPTGLAVTPDGLFVYVASQGANSVSVISTSNNSLVNTINVGATPVALAINPSGTQVYVVNQGSNQVSIIDVASQTVLSTLPVGTKPASVAFTPNGSRAFVTNFLGGNVTVIDTASRSVSGNFATLSGPNGIAVTPNGQFAYIANQYSGAVTVHAIPSGTIVSTINGFTSPTSLAITPSGGRVLVVNGNGNSVGVIDTGVNGLIGTVGVGSLPTSVAISTDGSRAYVTNEFAFTLSVIDTTTDALVATIPNVGVYPIAVATQPGAPPASVLNGISVNPNVIASGQTATGTVTLSGPAGSGGAWISLSSSDSSVASILGGVMIPQGLTSATFPVIAGSVVNPTGVTLTASYLGVYQTATLTVNPPGSSGTAAFIALDSGTQGNWKGVYGTDGYNVLGDSAAYPAYASVTPAGQFFWTWTSSTNDVRALQKVAASDRVAATWYSSSFIVDVNINDGKAHQVALYLLDWDSQGRAETIDVLNVAGAVLDTRSISGFSSGQYLVWNISGHVTFRVTLRSGVNAVLSGIFFGGGGATGMASFVKTDTATMGNWKGTYGTDGYNVLGDSAAYPAYASVTPAGQLFWTWASSTNDVRALQKAAASNRVAATWYSSSSFTVDVNISDGKTHQIALYFLDWDWQGRAQSVAVLNPTGTVLDTRSLSGFSNGQYLVWNISGHVTFRVTLTSGVNSVLSGIFF